MAICASEWICELCENWIFSGKAALTKRLSVHSWLCGGILLDSATQMTVLVWPCSLLCTVLPLLQTPHILCSEFTKPQALLYLNLSWHAWIFIFTCLYNFFFPDCGVICTTTFYLPQFSMAVEVQHTLSLWLSRHELGQWRLAHG